MSRTVYCRKYQEELLALSAPPFPGPKGEDIYENVSAKAWDDWIIHQTTLINEKHLNMMDKDARAYLNEQRERFLSGEEFDQVEGFVAPDPK